MSHYTSISPKDISTQEMQNYLLGGVAPRPIALASTIDLDGNYNLSPFSFFNAFGANPPTLVFSPARRLRDGTTKHTLENILAVPEVVINIPNYSMVQQLSLSSVEYGKGVDEFTKSGFTPIASTTIKPPRVAEAPVQYECKVQQVITLGNGAGAGHLVICEVQQIHILSSIVHNGIISQLELDAVARMGESWYVRCTADNMFQIPKPVSSMGVGVDYIPSFWLDKLTGNELGMLGNVEATTITTIEQNVELLKTEGWLETELTKRNFTSKDSILLIKEYLQNTQTILAWQVVLVTKNNKG